VATGLIGGTFDPIHIGHLVIAEEALDRFALRTVVFVPAARPPHKREDAVTPVEDRLEMVRLAIEGNPRLSLSDIEARRPSLSYTIETVRELRATFGEEELLFIMGADSLVQFLTWKDPGGLLSTCTFVVVPRQGADVENVAPEVRARVRLLDMPLIGISSRDIRERVRLGRTIRYLVPAKVQAFIEKKKLYS
jgi:nicotinate-nucleotide adenylyltransferase